MTNAIEKTKREMYYWLKQMKISVDLRFVPNYSLDRFEPELEAHLEELRKAMVSGNETMVRCANHSLDTILDLEARLESMTKERDEVTRLRHVYERLACDYTEKSADLEKRLIAMAANRDELARSNLAGDHAYSAMKQERDAIQLRLHAVDHAYSEQQRKAGTCGQVCGDRGASEIMDSSAGVFLDAIEQCSSILEKWSRDDIRAKDAIRKIAHVINNNPKLFTTRNSFREAVLDS